MATTRTEPLEIPDRAATEDLARRIQAAIHRTPDQIAAAREKAEKYIHPGRPLPKGKTIEAVFVGAIEDDMTEEEVVQALKDL